MTSTRMPIVPRVLLASLGALATAGCLGPRTLPFLPAAAGRAIYLLDMDADPFGLGGHPGAVFLLDVSRGSLVPVASSRAWRAPFAATAAPSPGTLWVLDFGYEQVRRGGDVRAGVFFEVDLRGPRPPRVSRPVRFLGAATGVVNPIGFAVEPWGVLVADEDADPLGLGVDTGALFLVDGPWTEEARPLAAGGDLIAPSDVAVDSDGRILLLDADADPTGANKGGGALFEVDARTGSLTLLAAPDYWVSPLALIPESSGSVLVIDSNVDPLHHGHLGGAVFRVRLDDPAAIDARTGLASVELVAAPEEFVDPVDGILLAPDWLLVADASADPLNLGWDGKGVGFGGKGRGAVWLVSLETGEAHLAAASPELVNPAGLVAVALPSEQLPREPSPGEPERWWEGP